MMLLHTWPNSLSLVVCLLLRKRYVTFLWLRFFLFLLRKVLNHGMMTYHVVPLRVLKIRLNLLLISTFLLTCNMLLYKEFITLNSCRMSISLKLGGDFAVCWRLERDMRSLRMNYLIYFMLVYPMNLDPIWIVVLLVFSRKEHWTMRKNWWGRLPKTTKIGPSLNHLHQRRRGACFP